MSNHTMAATGTNGYVLHLDVDDQGNTTFRVRSARTGKIHANVELTRGHAAFLASWLVHDTAPKPKRKHRATDGRTHKPTRSNPMSSNDVKCPTHQLDSEYVHLIQYVPGHGDMVVGGNYWHTPEERCTGQWQVAGYDTHGEHGMACVSAWDGTRYSDQLGGIEPDHTMTLPSVELVVEWLTSHGFTALETDVPALDAAWNRRPDPVTSDDEPPAPSAIVQLDHAIHDLFNTFHLDGHDEDDSSELVAGIRSVLDAWWPYRQQVIADGTEL